MIESNSSVLMGWLVCGAYGFAAGVAAMGALWWIL